MTTLEKAIQYVREHKTWTDAEYEVAIDCIDKQRIPLEDASEKIFNGIHDLMEEWSESHDMPEGWWYYETDEEDIFWTL